MTSIYYNAPLGNTSSSDGLNDFLLVSTIDYYNSLADFKDKYVPYVIEHDTLNEWEYGLGIVVESVGQDVLIRGDNISYPLTTVYYSSNNNEKVNFSAGSKTVKTTISAERINHGSNNYSYQDNDFIADTVQTTYGVFSSGSAVNVTLPLASGNKNLVLGFKLLHDSTQDLNISPSGSETIDGLTSLSLSTIEKYTTLISDGVNWHELVPEIDVTGVGLPVGSVGAIQYKDSSALFGGTDNLFWDSSDDILLIGGTTTSTASHVLPASSGQNILINNQQYNNDFIVKGTGNNQLFFDASTGRLGINTASPSTILHLVGRCANDTMRLESTTECPTGVALTLYHSPNTGSETGDYPATINLAGRNSNAELVNYAQIRSKILGTTIGSTSGELIFNVDHTGQSKHIASFNVGKINLGIESYSLQDIDNIIIGNLSKDSGTFNILIGHSGTINGTDSTNNIVISHDSVTRASNSVIIGNQAEVSGNYIYNIGSSATVNGDLIFNIGSNNSIVGDTNFVVGSGNTVSAENSYVLGDNIYQYDGYESFIIGNNITARNTSGYIAGFESNVSGSLNVINGVGVYVTGNNNTNLGIFNSITSDYNNVIGDNNSLSSSGNVVIGDSITSSNTNSVIIGRNLITDELESVVIGNNNKDLVISSNSFIFNTGLNDKNFIVYGTGEAIGLFFSDSRFGINKIADSTDYVLDINGTSRSSGLYTESFRLGLSSTSGSLLISDSSGNAQWSSLGSIQESLTENLLDEGFVIKSGTDLATATGIYWNNTSGLYTSVSGIENAYFVASTGDYPVTINDNNLSMLKSFVVKSVGNDNLLVADSTNSRIGINTTPTYNLDVSGTMRTYTDSLSYMQKTADSLILSYDEGVSTFRKIRLAASGIFFEQTNTGAIIPAKTFSTSTPPTSSQELQNINILGIDYNSSNQDYQIKFVSGIYAGFSNFTGTSETT